MRVRQLCLREGGTGGARLQQEDSFRTPLEAGCDSAGPLKLICAN